MIRLLLQLFPRRGGESATGPSPAARGPAALVAHQTRFDFRAAMRNPRARFFTLFFPILLLVIFDGVFGNYKTTVDGARVPSDQYYVGGIAAMAIITSCYVALTQRVVTQRAEGILKRRRATPVPAWVIVVGQALSTTVISLAVTAVLLVVGKAGFDVGIAAGGLLALAVTVVIGSLAFCCLGYALSSVINNADTAQPMVQFTLFPLYFISGVWVPTDSLPDGVRAVGEVFPVAHLANALHQAFVHPSFGAAFAPLDLLVVAAWAVAGVVVAARRFSWLPAEAAA